MRWKRFRDWLETVWIERRMWWHYKTGRYTLTRQWLDVEAQGADEVYNQVSQFVRQSVATSARPYGQGAYGLVLAAIWPEPEQSDRWEVHFTYPERLAAYEQLAARMGSWSPPPISVMVGVLPYGALALGRRPVAPRVDPLPSRRPPMGNPPPSRGRG